MRNIEAQNEKKNQNSIFNAEQPLLKLPNDILCLILSSALLTGKDVVLVAAVCTTLRSLVQQKDYLTKKIAMSRNQVFQISQRHGYVFAWRNFPSSSVLYAAGWKNYGDLGNAKSNFDSGGTFSSCTVAGNMTKIMQVSKGIAHTAVYGIDGDGKPLIATCGSNEDGQLGRVTPIFKRKLGKKYYDPSDNNSASFFQCLMNSCGVRNEDDSLFPHNDIDPEFDLALLPKSLVNIIQIATGWHTVIWGINRYGESLILTAGQHIPGEFRLLGTTPMLPEFKYLRLPENFKVLQIAAGGHRTLVFGCHSERGLVIIAYDSISKKIIELPKVFAIVHQIEVAYTGDISYILGQNEQGQPLFATLWRNFSVQFINLPPSMARADKIVLGDGYVGICGVKADRKPLLIKWNYADNNTPFLLFEQLPENFDMLIDVSFGKPNTTMVYGSDVKGNPLFAISGNVAGFEKYDKLTLVQLPECLQVLHPSVIENKRNEDQNPEKENEKSTCVIS